VCDTEVCDVFNDEWRRARKAHKCDACGETIRSGDLYMNIAMLLDGNWETVKSCARCRQMFLKIVRFTGEAADPTLRCGEVWEDPPDHVAALAFILPNEAQSFADKDHGA